LSSLFIYSYSVLISRRIFEIKEISVVIKGTNEKDVLHRRNKARAKSLAIKYRCCYTPGCREPMVKNVYIGRGTAQQTCFGVQERSPVVLVKQGQ